MKINYKNTALGILGNPNKFEFYLPEDGIPVMTELENQTFGRSIINAFENNSHLVKEFRDNIQFVTRPFYDAYYRSRNKLREIVLKEKFEEAGTLIIPWPNHTQTIFYYLNSNGNPEDWDYTVMIIMFTKTPKLDTPGLDLFVSIDNKVKQMKEFIWKGYQDEGRDSTWWISELLLFKTFLRYAEPETKIVNKQKKEVHLGEKYMNETNRRIEVLDSTYFTTISRTEGFGVKGHFRWKPYGPGMTMKKLQWISDFKKHGYHRTAKILREQS